MEKNKLIKQESNIKPDIKIELASLLPNPEHKYLVLNQIGQVIGLSNQELSLIIRVLRQTERGHLVFSVDGAEIELEHSIHGDVAVNIRLQFPKNLETSRIEKSEKPVNQKAD